MADKDLLFFNKEGDALNFNYNIDLDRYEGKLIFHENSSDTFKTIGLYAFERIRPFQYASPQLWLNKFQLFNEYGIDFVGSKFQEEKVEKIEVVNDDSSFFSKWVYGSNFEAKFPLGSEIKFDTPIADFTNPNQTYTVVGSKKGAIMILSNVDNVTFNSNFQAFLAVPSNYDGVTISGVNAIQVHEYIDLDYNYKLSSWSEPLFYDKLFTEQKLTIVNSEFNDGVVEVKNKDLLDNTYYRYVTNADDITSDFLIELTLKTQLPIVYNGNLTFDSTTNTLEFDTIVPLLLRPGIEFKAPDSALNTSFLKVDNIPLFDPSPGIYYGTQSQVLYNDNIYTCIQAYTQSTQTPQSSFNLTAVSPFLLDEVDAITPDDTNYWELSNFIPVDGTISNETLSGKVVLTSNVLYFDYDYDTSSEITAAGAVNKYQDDFDFFNIDLTYNEIDGEIRADLRYSTEYANVRFFNGGLTGSDITTTDNFYERLIEVQEELTPEENNDISELDEYNIVFTDLDEFGLRIRINGQVYYQETVFVFNGINIDLTRTIDKTLREWKNKFFYDLIALGIFTELKFTGLGSSIYVNSINLKTVYPNVPLTFDVEVGTTANYYIEDSYIIFYDMGQVLNIVVNGRSYVQTYSGSIPQTLEDWVDQHSLFLSDIGIFTRASNQVLYFNVEDDQTRIDVQINLGKSFKPGELSYVRKLKRFGNEGVIISANEVLASDTNINLEDEGFATGQLVSLGNSGYVLNNQEYNILYLNPDRIVLSYQGPFWGNTQSVAGINAFLTIGFDNESFGYDPSANNISVPIVPTYSSATYSVNAAIDLDYVQPAESIYVLGNNMEVFDADNSLITDTIPFGTTQSIESELNIFNGSVYSLTQNTLWRLDPLTNIIVGSMSLPYTPHDMAINEDNGDIYISFENSNSIYIYDENDLLVTTINAPTSSTSIVYNDIEEDIFVGGGNSVIEIDGDTRTIIDTFGATGISSDLFYNPFTGAVYSFNQNNLFKISLGSVTEITGVVTATSSYFAYNPYTERMYISTADNFVYEVDGNDSITGFSNIFIHGPMVVAGIDENIYIASNNSYDIQGYNTLINDTFTTINLPGATSSRVSNMVYNPNNGSIVAIDDSGSILTEIFINTLFSVTPRVFSWAFSDDFLKYLPLFNAPDNLYELGEDERFGFLDPNYEGSDGLILSVREYIRRPRQNFETDNDVQVKYRWEWVDDQTPDIFIYDFSGDHLPTQGAYAYTGPKPLDEVYLNREPNDNVDLVSDSKSQQTIFSSIEYELDYIDSTENISFVPEPLQLFIGYNSLEEGVDESELLLKKIEDISFDIITNGTNMNIITFEEKEDNGVKYGEISLNTNSTDLFNNRNLKEGQHITIYVRDNTNNENQAISFNNGRTFKIRNIYSRIIIVDYLDHEIANETTVLENYPVFGMNTYFTTTIQVAEKEIGRFKVYGQTEIEDIRYKIELNNVGKNLNPEDAFIFKSYDINEQGVDWTFLNKKRKEMLLVKDQIFNYIGAYKSIINAINLFGYNDLELYEYYRNINRRSPNFNKLFKVEIPDIFDNTVEGWEPTDFLLSDFPNDNYDATKLFNLTYKITDKQGNNVLQYSLDEVLIKLEGLKNWLEKNVVPITHEILDITGRADTVGVNTIQHENYDINIINIYNDMTPINFTVPEAYLLPVNSGSTVFNVVIEFDTEDDFIPDYFTIDIRTYKTYPEWEPFETYSQGDIISYTGKIFESVEDGNRLNNPNKYSDATSWNENQIYYFGQIVEYQGRYYQYSVLEDISSGPSPSPSVIDTIPPINNPDWLDVTEWIEIDLVPVQKISEYRSGDLLPFNFTIDSKIDPYVIIEVTSDNGYGEIYTVKKSVEIRIDADPESVLVDPT